MQSIWHAVKFRRVFRVDKKTKLRAIITIQRFYCIYRAQKAQIKIHKESKNDAEILKRMKEAKQVSEMTLKQCGSYLKARIDTRKKFVKNMLYPPVVPDSMPENQEESKAAHHQ